MRAAIGLGGVVLVGFVTVHCSGLEERSDCLDYDTCQGIVGEGGAGEAGDGGKEGAVIPPTCDLTKGVRDSPDCVDDGVGIFVSAGGKDGATGTKADPVRTIAQGIAAASTSGKPRVYVCEGVYDASVVVAQSISIHGGLTCAWAVKADARPKVSPSKGVALSITRVSGAVVVEDFEIVGSSDPNTAGDSAIAVFVSDSKNVTFRRSVITAGNGQAGSKGKTGSNYTGASAMNGMDANAANGGGERTCACADSKTSSKGGRGGSANSLLAPTSGSSTPAVGGINEGGTGSAACTPGTGGDNGNATDKGAGATQPGSIGSSGWDVAKLGTAGGGGNPGQGGGGGGAINNSSQGGSGGACGGCGGRGGDPGTNGGSSFAILSFESSIVLTGCTLTTGNGGKGGDGGDGQDGQGGGATGLGACAGGTGGIGAGGSGGGGGAGGHSAPVAYRGSEPRLDGSTASPGGKGPVGNGGLPGQGGGNPGNVGDPGAEGKSAASLALP